MPKARKEQLQSSPHVTELPSGKVPGLRPAQQNSPETHVPVIKKPAPRKASKAAPDATFPSTPGTATPSPIAGPQEQAPPLRRRLSKAFSRPLDKILRKQTLVRDRFTIPEKEYEQLKIMKRRLADQGLEVKKSELVRAGLKLLSEQDDQSLKQALSRVT